MKMFLILLSAIFLVVSLSACAGTTSQGGMKVKCPACGHSFDTDDPYGG